MKINPIDFLQQLVKCPSITPKEEGAITLLENTLTELGFKCHRLKFEEEGTEPVENLYARYGDTSPNFCFAGHTDVVSVGEGWTHPPFDAVIDNGTMYGRGTEDMKGGIACFTSAVSKFLENENFKGSISFLITNDEEGIAINGTKKVLKWLEEKGEKLDVCLVGEPTNKVKIGDSVKVGRRGSLNTKLTIYGTQGHVAYQDLAVNPISIMIKILGELDNLKLDDGNEFFQPSNLEITSIDVGNKVTNIIPEKAEARLNIRFNTHQSLDGLCEIINKIVAKYADKFDIKFDKSGEAFSNDNENFTNIVRTAIKNCEETEADFNTGGGTSDARFIKDYCTVLEFGLISKTLHKVNECVKIDDLHKVTDIYYEVLKLYFK